VVYLQSHEGVPQLLVSVIPVPIGPSSVQFRFMRTAPYQGIGTLHIDGRMVNSAFFEQTLTAPPYQGLDIGVDGGDPITDAYHAPFPFEGTLHRVVFEISTV
jgi:hypothetical protein